MYINSEHKAPFLDYLSHTALTAITVRNFRSDINHFFKWLEAYRFAIPRSEVLSSYETYLISNNIIETTRLRRMQTIHRFIKWLDLNFPSDDTQLRSEPRQNTAILSAISPRDTVRRSGSNKRSFLVFIVIFIVFLACLCAIPFTLKIASIDKTQKPQAQPQLQTIQLPFIISFDNKFDMLQLTKTELLFKIYRGSSPNAVIGLFKCVPKKSMINKELSRLEISIGRDCGTISKDIQTIISSENTLLADIFIDEDKLTSSKVVINGQNVTESLSNYQRSKKDGGSDISEASLDLPIPQVTLSTSGQYIASESASVREVIPFTLFANSDIYQEGDIIAIYKDSLIRAILSTKVLGVQTFDGILTKGIVDVNMVDQDVSIVPGDYISTSSEPGLAKKAISSLDTVIGIALEAYVRGDNKLQILLGK
jgi:hypothetical protein